MMPATPWLWLRRSFLLDGPSDRCGPSRWWELQRHSQQPAGDRGLPPPALTRHLPVKGEDGVGDGVVCVIIGRQPDIFARGGTGCGVGFGDQVAVRVVDVMHRADGATGCCRVALTSCSSAL